MKYIVATMSPSAIHEQLVLLALLGSLAVESWGMLCDEFDATVKRV